MPLARTLTLGGTLSLMLIESSPSPPVITSRPVAVLVGQVTVAIRLLAVLDWQPSPATIGPFSETVQLPLLK